MPRKKYGETSFGERLQNIRNARGMTPERDQKAVVGLIHSLVAAGSEKRLAR